MKKKIELLIILLILVFSFFLYTYKLDKIPSGYYVDEATIAYNAKSIAETGKDEYGKSYPVLFRLFGSYTPPLYIYLSAISYKVFGGDVAVFRMQSVISALATIVIFFLLTKSLKVFKLKSSYFIATFFYAISPWLVFNARLGYETTFAYMIFLIGVYLLFLGLKNIKFILWGIPILSLSIYIAHPTKYLFFIFLPFYFIFFGKEILKKKNMKPLLYSIIVTLFIQVPNIILAFSPAFWIKNSAFFEQGMMNALRNFIYQLVNYYSLKSIFFEMPDIDLQHTVPTLSILYSWMILPFIVGFVILLGRIKNVNYKYMLFLFFVTVLPGAVSGRFISMQRIFQILPYLILITGIGIDAIFVKLSKGFRWLFFLGFSVYSLLLLYRGYFIIFPKERSYAWNYGYDKLSEYILKYSERKFLIDNSRNPRVYIELLYFMNYPPQKYQSEVSSIYRDNYYLAPKQDFKYNFANIEVKEIDWKSDPCEEKIIVGDYLSVSESQAKEHILTKIYKINDVFGNPLFLFYETNPGKKCGI